MKAAVLGATGYTGGVLLRLLGEHPEVKEIIAVSSSQAGQAARDVDPGLSSTMEKKMSRHGGRLVAVDEAVKAASARELDVVFSALPHLKSAEICAPFLGRTVVIDLSADFRLKDPATFARAYGSAMPRPDLAASSVYGLAEWHTDKIRSADIIAAPGCYPTATLLPAPSPGAGGPDARNRDRERHFGDIGRREKGEDRPPVLRAVGKRERVLAGNIPSARP